MHSIAVGQLYLPSRTSYPEGCEYNFSANGHELKLFFNNPSKGEIHEVRKGLPRFKLLFYRKSVVFLCFKLGALPWSDAPYSWWRVPEEVRSQPQPIPEGEGALLTIVLIDSETGIVKAIRAIGLPTDLSRELHRAIAHQTENPELAGRYDADINAAYRQFLDTDAMVREATNGDEN